MNCITPNKWIEFQHYKDRSPTWLKLHKSLLDDYEFQSLQVASRALAPMLWLLASEYTDGHLPLDYPMIAFRLRTSAQEVQKDIKPLIDKGFFILEQDASELLAGCLPREEKRREEKRREEEGSDDSETPTSEFSEILSAYHAKLPNCEKVAILTDTRKRVMRNAVKNAKRVCRERGWNYGPDFWNDFFDDCAKDPWLAGNVPNPKNAKWKQRLDVILRDEHFAQVIDRALAGAA